MWLKLSTFCGYFYGHIAGYNYIGYNEEDEAYYFYAPMGSKLRKRFRNMFAFTVGRCIFMEKRKYLDDPEITNHEVEHINQYKRLGLWFPILYTVYHITHGYDDNPFEVEARKAAE